LGVFRAAGTTVCRRYIRAVRARDTTAESHDAQLKVYRRLGASRRAYLAARLSADVRRLSRAGIRSRHPAYTDEEVELALRRLLHGDDLFRRAWPGRPLLAP
jgi:hypothetical protein